MKKIILAALLTLATAPAFAADIPAISSDQNAMTEQNADDQAIDENAFSNQLNEQNVDEQWIPPGRRPSPRPQLFLCYSRDLLGRQYWGQAWNRNQAANASLRTCRSRARIPFACRFVGCQTRY
jgi:hypothetical protein